MSLQGVTKLDGRGRVGMDCIRELGTFCRLGLRSILNFSHKTRNYVLYILFGKPSLSVHINKAVI